jgi:hypothetical protein
MADDADTQVPSDMHHALEPASKPLELPISFSEPDLGDTTVAVGCRLYNG